MTVFITIVLVILVAVAVMIWFWQHDRQRRKDAYISLLITLAGTFAGVFLAVWLSDQQTEHSDRQQLIYLLQQSKEEIESQQKRIACIAHYGFLPPGHVTNMDYLIIERVPPIYTLQFVIESPVFLSQGKFLSRSLLTEIQNLNKINNSVDLGSNSPMKRKIMLDNYMIELFHIKGILKAGIDYLMGHIKPDKLEARLKDLVSKKVFHGYLMQQK